MQQPFIQSSKTTLYTVGFVGGAAEVLPQHTGWPLLQDRFQVIDVPVATEGEQQGAAVNARVKHESTSRAAAAVVASVEQQLQTIQQLREASATLFIVCW
jgi:hypothetical protein